MTSRDLPAVVPGYGPVRPFTGVLPPPASVTLGPRRVSPAVPGRGKLLADLDAASGHGRADAPGAERHAGRRRQDAREGPHRAVARNDGGEVA